MRSFTLLLISVLFACLWASIQSASTVRQCYGSVDNFNDDRKNREWLPMSGTLQSCDEIDWEDVGGLKGDKRPPDHPWFDYVGTNNALAWTVTSLPQTVANLRIQMKIKGYGKYAYNDVFAFFWDENIPEDGEDCRVAYSYGLQSLPGNEEFGNDVVYEVDWDLAQDPELLDKVLQEGYFHFLVGDDTAVDYFCVSYDNDLAEADLSSYTCNLYESDTVLIPGSQVYTDGNENTVVTSIEDSADHPFQGTQFIKSPTVDRTQVESVFKMEIAEATRFWLFVPATCDLGWVDWGKWTLLEDASVTLANEQTFQVFTKRYDGDPPHPVIFGAPSSRVCENPAMYFVAFAPTTTLIPTPVNPNAECGCRSTGDPHLQNFDNRIFDFYEAGVHHLTKARDCIFDIQVVSFKWGITTVNGVAGLRLRENTVTLAREERPAGQLWQGRPVVRYNGEVIDSSMTAGGFVIVKLSTSDWEISIPEVGVRFLADEADRWFHLYTYINDLYYSLRVDGLCGNCDGKTENDFLFPDCAPAVTKTSNLHHTETVQWGNSWSVSDAEDFSSTDKLTQALGDTAFQACRAAPIRQECAAVTGGNEDPEFPVEPLPPAEFFECEDTTPIIVIDPPHPETTETTGEESDWDCLDHPLWEQIKQKCQDCTRQTGYPSDDCIQDLCLQVQEEPDITIDDYTCIGHEECIEVPVVETVSYVEWEFAELTGLLPQGDAHDGCRPVRYSLPEGWEVAPNSELSRDVIAAHTWQTFCMTTLDGSTHPTAEGIHIMEGECPHENNLLITFDGCYMTKRCNTGVLIRKPFEPKCGNGIVEEGEQCDDGNLFSGDGCSSTCDEEPNWVCIPGMVPNRCTPTENVEEEDPEFHVCTLEDERCKPCVLTDENRDAETCCDCQLPCC